MSPTRPAPTVAPLEADTRGDRDAVCHLVNEGDWPRAICGADITGHREVAHAVNPCIVCADLAGGRR